MSYADVGSTLSRLIGDTRSGDFVDHLIAPTTRASLRLSLTVRHARNVLSLVGDLDVATAPQLERTLRRLELSCRPAEINIDRLRFVDSFGWEVVEATRNRRAAMGSADLRMVGGLPQMRRTLAVIEAAIRRHPS